MFENLSQRFNRGKELFSQLSSLRKVLLLGGLAAVFSIFVVLILWANQTEYGLLYSGLEQNDAGAIVKKLNDFKIPYKLKGNGSTIEVPKTNIEETRLILAQEGLPVGGSIGLEVFDETKLGETEFVQHLNYQRALQGELERTIKKFDAVDQARVHLNIPKESLFIEEELLPTASVVLSLKRGKSLTRSQLQGVVHLVASSVEGLSADNITVVDTSGGLLYSKDETGQSGLLSATQVEYQRNLEQELSRRVNSMLERVVGPEKAMTRVTAELGLQQISTNEEVYDPDRTAVRSEQRLRENSRGPGRGAEGIPQTTFELGTGNEDDGGQGANSEIYERSEETTNYEITKINRQILSTAGDIKRLSVAVMVDGIYPETVKDGQTVKAFQTRPQSELDKLEELVKNAVGFDKDRGDTVVVQCVPFYLPEEAKVTWMDRIVDLLHQHGRSAINIAAIVFFFLFIVRPLLSWLKRETEPVVTEDVPAALPEGEDMGAIPDYKREPGKLTRDQVLLVAQQDPERTINLLRSWIDEG
jgi:flagellar M-ring protein FliF